MWEFKSLRRCIQWNLTEWIPLNWRMSSIAGSSIPPPGMSYSPTAGYLQGLTVSGTFDEHTAGPPSNEQQPMLQPPVCYTPPDSVTSATTPSPSGAQADANMSSHQEDNFVCTSFLVQSPDPPTSVMALPSSQTPLWDRVNTLSPSAKVPAQSTASRFTSQRSKVISARCSQASIEIVNPKDEYDKIQKKHGPRGKYSEQRIQNGMVRADYSLVSKQSPKWGFWYISQSKPDKPLKRRKIGFERHSAASVV